jgi:putative methyltransferase (TIGR04325 family)
VNAREIVRSLTPPAVLQLRRRLRKDRLRFSGHPSDWADAQRMCSGYDSAEILQHVAQATRAVVRGEAAFERDSVLFHEPALPFPLLAALLRAAVRNGGRLDVVDFGGSLGSTYRQCRPFFEDHASIRWSVVEQPAFVALGRTEFTTGELAFFESVAQVPATGPNGVVLLSSVLQYLEDPAAVLAELGALDARHLVFDRTPISNASADRLCIQYVPASIYPASYPCRIFAREPLLSLLGQRWRLIGGFDWPRDTGQTEDGLRFELEGLILEKRS